jgi:ACS family D-galactonate transporter-like MFS transporter
MVASNRKRAWLTVSLLFFFVLINFADKAVIGIAAVPIMQELKLNPREFGLLASSFYLLFAVSAIATGFLVNRMPTRWVLLAMALVWALTQFPMIGSVGFGTLVAARIALGAGEGPATPVALHATYKWFPNELRTLPTAIIVQGGALGVLVTLPLLNWAIVHCSWHWAFGALGISGLAWCILWLAFGREGSLAGETTEASQSSRARIDYRALLLSPTILGCWAAAFGANWALSLALSWQGAFLIKGLELTQGSIGILGALPAVGSVIVMLTAGWYSQHLLSRGVSSRLARGVLGGLCVSFGGAALVAMPYVPGITAKIVLTSFGVALPSVIYVIGNTVVGEVTPVAQRGALLAIGTAIATSAGLLAPYVMGSIVQDALTPLTGFNTGFTICGWILLIGGAIGTAFIRPERDAMQRAREFARMAVETQ